MILMLTKISSLVPEKYRKYVRYGYDIFLICLFVGMAYYCATTNCYEVTDQYGNPIPKEEIKKILVRYVNDYNRPMNFTFPTNLTPYQTSNYTND